MDPVVMSIGGSVLGRPDEGMQGAARIGPVLGRVGAKPLGIVAGGGQVARWYISSLREAGLDEYALDQVGILGTRLNAWSLLAHLPDAHPHPCTSIDEATAAMASHPQVVMGGTHPGHTTDAVAAFLAERSGASRFVIVTNVDGVYDKDPRKHDDAQRLPQVSSDELVRIAGGTRKAGSSGVVDPMAAQVIHRSGIPLRVVSGEDEANIHAALEGKDFHGTEVTP